MIVGRFNFNSTTTRSTRPTSCTRSTGRPCPPAPWPLSPTTFEPQRGQDIVAFPLHHSRTSFYSDGTVSLAAQTYRLLQTPPDSKDARRGKLSSRLLQLNHPDQSSIGSAPYSLPAPHVEGRLSPPLALSVMNPISVTIVAIESKSVQQRAPPLPEAESCHMPHATAMRYLRLNSAWPCLGPWRQPHTLSQCGLGMPRRRQSYRFLRTSI